MPLCQLQLQIGMIVSLIKDPFSDDVIIHTYCNTVGPCVVWRWCLKIYYANSILTISAHIFVKIGRVDILSPNY